MCKQKGERQRRTETEETEIKGARTQDRERRRGAQGGTHGAKKGAKVIWRERSAESGPENLIRWPADEEERGCEIQLPDRCGGGGRGRKWCPNCLISKRPQKSGSQC